MKFGHIWKQTLKELPINLQSHVLDYKRYKKLLKTVHLSSDLTTVKQRIIHDVNAINHFSMTSLPIIQQQKQTRFGLCKCNTITNDQPSEQAIKAYIELNNTTLYKICKRASKRLNDPSYLNWLATYKQQDRDLSGIFGGFIRSYLKIRTSDNNNIECPICLDDIKINVQKVMMLDCGHTICLDCVKSYLGINNLKGTIGNLIAHGVYMTPNISCPICKRKHPFSYYKIL
jgi:hypothetical protein